MGENRIGMGQITGGRVVYGRTVQPAQYESKKAEVEITFAVAEGEDHAALLDLAAKVACYKAHEMVGISVIKNPPKPAAAAPSEQRVVIAPANTKEAAAAAMNAKDTKDEHKNRKPGRPPKVPVDPAALADDAKGHQAKMDEFNPAKANI